MKIQMKKIIVENRKLLFFIIISILGIGVRYCLFDVISGDAEGWFIPLFWEMKEKGGFSGLSIPFGDYNITYQILVAFITYLPFDPLYLYKELSIVFDYSLALAAGRLAYVLTDRKFKYLPLMAYTAVLFLPTVVLNSAAWAQCDVIYSSFVMWALLFLFEKKYKRSFIFLGIAFAFKLQAVFILPFFIYYYFSMEKSYPLYDWLLIPLAHYATCIPAFFNGRSIAEPLTIYFTQTGEFNDMWLNFPSFWTFLGNQYEFLNSYAILLTVLVLGVGLLYVLERKKTLSEPSEFLCVAIWTVWTCVLFLPAMHERYAYVLEVLLVVLAVLDRKYLAFACVAEFVSILTYGVFLFASEVDCKALAVIYFVGYVWYSYILLQKDSPQGRLAEAEREG